MTAFDGSTPEAEVGAFIDAVRRAPDRRDELVALLPENLPLYAGRSAAEVTRLRGYALAAFADLAMPASALPYALEALQSGDMAYEVAGAAIGLRGLEAPSSDLVPYLLQAIDNLTGADATVSFEAYNARWPYDAPTTALTEVVRTLAWLGANAASYVERIEALAAQRERFSASVLDELQLALQAIRADISPPSEYSCCDDMAFIEQFSAQSKASVPATVTLEDQDGASTTFETFFRGKPSVVAFFYTRCDNPYKCSLTVTKLAALQASLRERGLAGAIKIAAITYDPEFDLPHRLKLYGADRGVVFGEDARFFRATTGFAELRERLCLGVNYGASTVNRHQIEVYVLDAQGETAASFTRLQWQVDEVMAAVEALLVAAA